MIAGTLRDGELSQGCVAMISSGGMGARIAAGAAVAKLGMLRVEAAQQNGATGGGARRSRRCTAWSGS